MDKELLRVVIVLIGALVMVAMLLWHYLKVWKERRDIDDEYPEDGYADDEEEYPEEDVALHIAEEEEFDSGYVDSEPKAEHKLADKPAKQNLLMPRLIKFYLAAHAGETFHGVALFDALERSGLQYSRTVRVFERIDQNYLVDFSVASMDEPGIFPDSHLEDFHCHGIVFYLQPREVDNPLAVFDDFIETIDTLAMDLDGVALDSQHELLTAETIAQFRGLLSKQ